MLVVALTLAFLFLFGIFLTVAALAISGQASRDQETRRIAREFVDMQAELAQAHHGNDSHALGHSTDPPDSGPHGS